MFCCARKQSHRGQIVTSLCLQPQCSRSRNQLSCTLCCQQDHQGHSLTSLAKVLPSLLQVERQREDHRHKLTILTQFICRQFGDENEEGEPTTIANIVQRALNLLSSLKQQSDVNAEQMAKMKSIFRTLTRNNQQNSHKTSPSRIDEHLYAPQSPQKNNPSSILSKMNLSSTSKISQIPLLHSLQFDSFSHTSKHPYLSISANLRTATKVSHSGHRFATVGARCFSEKQHQLRLRVDRSVSGNILLGVCHQSVVRQKQFCNSYGSNSGTYLIGQNGNNPSTAISFHHSVSVMNRKQIVGWNFEQGDTVVVGINFPSNFIYFRRQAKKPSQEFSMKISTEQVKPQLKGLINEGFKVIVLLQSEGDQVSIIQE